MQDQVDRHLNTITIIIPDFTTYYFQSSFPLYQVCSLSCVEWFQTQQTDTMIVYFCPSTLSHIIHFVFYALYLCAKLQCCIGHVPASDLLCNRYEHNSTQTESTQYPHTLTLFENSSAFHFLSIALGFSIIYMHEAPTSPRNNIPFGGNQEHALSCQHLCIIIINMDHTLCFLKFHNCLTKIFHRKPPHMSSGSLYSITF